MMTPVNTPHGGIGASIALRPAPQGRRSHPSAGMTAVTGGCPNQNFARHLDGQFLDSEVVMKKRMHLGCLGGQRRFGAAFGEFGCQITRPAAIFCQILTVGPCSWRLVGVVVLAAALCCADCSTEKPSDYPPGTMTGAVFIPINKPLLALPSGQVTPNGGNLPFSITNQIILASNNTIATTKDVENTNKLVLTISKTTPDAISASFANPAEPKQTIKVNGVILQGQTNAQGYFL